MSDPTDSPDSPASPASPAASAGALLRTARERQGLHIAALAAAIKVTQRKLEALEADRWSELPDATFVRALAQTVCRTLKIDARPVLDLLPRGGAVDLQPTAGTLNTPFRERPGRDDPGLTRFAVRPMVLGAVALVAAAGALYLLPAGTLNIANRSVGAQGAASAASAVGSQAPVSLAASGGADGATSSSPAFPDAAAAPAAPASAPAQTVEGVSTPFFPAPSADPAVTVSAPAAAAPASAAVGIVQVRTTGASWVEVRNAKGQVILSRTVTPADPVGLDADLPMKLTIGNAAATSLVFRGQPVDLKPSTRDNVARVALPQ
jgi:cytoskeleton protein RodZ